MARKKEDIAANAPKWEDVPEIPKEEQPYPLPEGWKWVRLIGGFADCLDGYRKPVNSSEREKRKGYIPYYGATGQVGWIDDYLTDENLVLVGEDGAPFLDAQKNKAYIIDGKAWVNNHAHILRSFFGKIGNIYLMHYLNQFNYTNYVNGTTRLKLTQGSLRKFYIPTPPIEIMFNIVNIIEAMFSKLDEAAAKVQTVIDGHEARKQAVLHKAFSGKLTKKWREENGVSFESWEVKTLQEVCAIPITDGTHQTPTYSDKDNGIPFLSSKDVTKKYIDWDNVKYITKELHNILYRRIAPKKGDILLAKNGTTGVAAIVSEDKVFDIYVTLALLRPNINIINKFFLLHLINSNICKKQFNDKLIGIGLPNLHLRDIKNVYISVPGLYEQNEIAHIIDKLYDQENKIKNYAMKLIAKINLIKTSILNMAFNGKI